MAAERKVLDHRWAVLAVVPPNEGWEICCMVPSSELAERKRRFFESTMRPDVRLRIAPVEIVEEG